MRTPSFQTLHLGRGGPIDGQQRQLLYLTTGLSNHGKPPVVIIDGAGPLNVELRGCGINTHVHPMSPWRTFSRIFKRYVDARRLLNLTLPLDLRVVHAHDVWRAEYARFIARRRGVPYVVHVRGPLSARDIQKHRLKLTDAIIAIAQRYVDGLIAAGIDRERIALIDDAVDLSLFNPSVARPTPALDALLPRGTPVIGFVGRISPFKRVCEFLDIAAKLPAFTQTRPAILVIGDVEDEAYARQVNATVRRLGLSQQVLFIGRQNAEAMPHVLAVLDLLVTLSGGSVMFEAMAMGKTVLSIRADGQHSRHTRHDETAWCLDTEDPLVCARELARLIDDGELRQRLGTAARECVLNHLSIETMVNKTIALYDRIVVARNPADSG
jgi:glycosyltransferase involved in cell wall biosynthesis